MALLNVQNNGNAPTNSKVGDYITTAGGTYEVLDGNAYKNMTPEQLTNAGVNFNSSNGLYSKKVSDVANGNSTNPSTVQVKPVDGSMLSDWLKTSNNSATSQLNSAFATDKANMQYSYNTSKRTYKDQKDAVKKAYLNNITQLYDDAYNNREDVLANASDRGLLSSGLGNAMTLSSIADASKQNAYYRDMRDESLNSIDSQINTLTDNYKVNLDALEVKLNNDGVYALSENEKAYMEALMQLEQYNTEAYNNALATSQQQAYEKEMYLQQLANSRYSSGSYGGSGYYGSGGSYGGSYGGSGYSSGSGEDVALEVASGLYYNLASKPWITDTQKEKVSNTVNKVANGTATVKDVADKVVQINNDVLEASKAQRRQKEAAASKKKSVKNTGSAGALF